MSDTCITLDCDHLMIKSINNIENIQYRIKFNDSNVN